MDESSQTPESVVLPSSSVAVEGVDPGPLARLEAVKADSVAASVVFQRVTEGETLRQIAADWGVPRGRFTEWYTTQYGEMYEAALKVRADELSHERLEIVDAAVPEDVAVAKLRSETRGHLASKWDRQRYGEHTKVEHGGHVTGLIAVLSSLPSGRVVEQAPDEPEKPV